MPDYNSLLEGFGATTKPLDAQGDYNKLLEGFTPVGGEVPSVSPETVQDVTKQPVGRPEGTGQPQPEGQGVVDTGPVYPDLAEKRQIQQAAQAALEAQGVSLSPYVTGASYGTAIENIGEQARKATELRLSQEGREAAKEFVREEALPVVTATVATLLAPATGGSSLPLALAITSGTAGGGAFVGEAIEQKLKQEGILTLSKDEVKPRDAWDILERSAWRGGEEAAFALIPDMLFRGIPTATRRLLTKGSKEAVTVDGQVIDRGRSSLQNIIKNYADKRGQDASELLLTSDIVDSGLFNAAENVAANSYITGKRIKEIRGAQEVAIKEEITEAVGQYYRPAEGYVKENVDGAIAQYVEANFESMNDFAVAGLVRLGFQKAQEAQKSVSRAIYKQVGELMDRTTMKPVYKEVELPILGPNGRPLTTMQTVQVESPAFPVDLKAVRALGEERMDILSRTNAPIDSQTAELLNFPSQADFNSVSERLIDMKADSRSLGKSTAEGSAKKKLVLDKAIAEIEKALDASAKAAEDAGIVGPDGQSVYELKRQADAIWKEQVEDFQNSYLLNIIKNTNPKNGAPEKLGRLFMQNETAARNIIKILDDAKGTLKGAELEQITQAENAIKGSIVEELFMPFDSATGKYIAPDVRPLVNKESELRKIFGDEHYEALRDLGAAIEQQSGANTSNYLGFAQRARESGMIITTMKTMLDDDGPTIRRIAREGGSTVLFALGAGKLLTSPKMVRQVTMLNNPEVPEAVKVQIFQWLVHRTYEYQQAVEASLTPTEKERAQARQDDEKEASRMRMGPQGL